MTDFEALVERLWQRNRGTVLERIAVLRRAAGSPGDEALRADALRVAHQLAGSLGSYGMPDGSRAAADIEQELREHAPGLERLDDLLAALERAVADRG